MHQDLLARRDDYPILSRRTYLVTHSLGAMHRGTRDRLAEYADVWATDGVVAWEHWIAEMARIADLVGTIIGAPPGTTVLRANVASALADLASAIDFTGRRNKVVYSALEWPGSHYLWRQHRKFGARAVVVPADSDGVGFDLQRFLRAIDADTAIVPISHVLFRTSTLVDVRSIVERAHAVGALVVLDTYQSAGTVPFSVSELDVDAAVGGSVKYLCGGPGNGYLYVAPRLVEQLRPASVGWFGHKRPFDFAFEEIEYAEGIRRFTGGTPNVPAAYAAEPAYQALVDIGIDRVRERSVSLTQPLLEGALERGFAVRSPVDPRWRGGHVTIDPGDAQRVHEELIARNFVIDHRPGVGIRVGPHFYNTAEECTALLDEMEKIRG
ncbi:MAG: kynureninase [Frankiales bacterium]|jgi:kynureninase|nr:kynureninase [Frankiales bacterium]